MKKPNQQTGFNTRDNSQYGGTILGFLLGLGVGLGVAFLIAFYLSKNTPQERPGVRAPDLPLTIKPTPASADSDEPSTPAPLDLNKALQGKSMPAPASGTNSDPIADLVNGKKSSDAASASKADTVYFLQVGAFSKRPDADAQKANLAIQGIQSQLSEVTADGNTVWRVRVGPYNSLDDSNAIRDKLSSMGIKATVIKSIKS